MTILEGTFDEAMRFVAERRLFAEMQKQADDTPTEPASRGIGGMAADAGLVGVGGLAAKPLVYKGMENLLGAQKFYHGTSNATAAKIYDQGLLSSMGGATHGGSALSGNQAFVNNSRRHVHVATGPLGRPMGMFHGLFSEMGGLDAIQRGEPARFGTTIKGYLPHDVFKSRFRNDPDWTMPGVGNVGAYKSKMNIPTGSIVKGGPIAELKTMFNNRAMNIPKYLLKHPVRAGLGAAAIGGAGYLGAKAIGAGHRLLADTGLVNQPGQTVKKADAEKAKKSHGARQSLGVLGANEGGINKAVSSLRKGEISPGKAERSIRSNVPGVLPQIKNVLRPFSGSVGTAIRQNRVGDALSQADVLGLKNLNPASEEFSPTTATASAGLGIGTGLLQSRIANNKMKYEVMRGGGKEDPMGKAVKTMNRGPKGTTGDKVLAAWRRRAAQGQLGHEWLDPHLQWLDKNKYTAQARPGISSWLKRNLLGPSMQFQTSHPGMTRNSTLEKMLSEAATTATRHHRNGLPIATKGLNMLGALGLPAAAASLPLLYREWLGRGYRSGRRPAHDLVEANKPMVNK